MADLKVYQLVVHWDAMMVVLLVVSMAEMLVDYLVDYLVDN